MKETGKDVGRTSNVKRNATLVCLGLLLVLAVLASVKLNKDEAARRETQAAGAAAEDVSIEPALEASAPADYFQSFRDEREAVRSMEIEYLDEIIATSANDAETLNDAQQQKLELVNNMEKEFVIENLIRAKGFADAAVTFRGGAVNVVVSAEQLSQSEVAQILDIVRSETGESADNIKILTGS